MKKFTTIPENKPVSEKDIIAELRKYITAADIVTFRLSIETARESKPSYANVTDLPFTKSCEEILVTDDDIKRLSDNAYIGGVSRVIKKLRISGNLAMTMDVITRLAYAKISEMSNGKFVAMTAKKILEVSRLYDFS